MPLKEKSYKEQKNEALRGKRRYIERIIEQEEAEKEIREYEDSTDERDSGGFDGQRSFSRERGEGFVS